MIFRKLLYILPLTGVLLFFTAPPPVNAQAVTYYVSSTSGNDTNNGLSEATPWKTIDQVNAATLPDNSIILFKRGDIFRGAITALKSPKGLTFGAYGTGDNPIIAGSVPITGWKPTTNSTLSPKVYEADVTTLPLSPDGIEQLFVNGELMTIARYPNVTSPAEKNWLKVGASSGTDAFTDRALVLYAKPDNYWKGATLRFRTSWTYTILPITAYNATAGKITATGLGTQLPEWGYFIDGKLEELDAEGEWYYDANAKKVYFYPKGGANPNTLLIEGVTYDTGISISNQENNTTIENLTFRHFTGKGVSLISSDNLLVRNCHFEHNVVGIALWNSANTQVTGNTFDHHLKDSIALSAQSTFDVQQTIISNNTITNTGMYPAYGVRSNGVYQGLGISVFGKAYTVRQNTIDWSSHSGMYLKDGGHHLIENNIVSHSLALLNDGGAIAISSDGNTIRGNFLLESIGNVDDSNGCASLNTTPCNHHPSYGMGIGADSNFQDNVIEGNTVANNTFTGIRLNAYINTTVRNNVLYNNATQLSVEDTHGTSSNNVVDGNIFYSLTPDQIAVYLTNATNHGSLDNNSYCNPYSEVTFVRDSKRYSLASWQTAFPTYDKTSKQCSVQLPEYSVSNVGTNLFSNSTFTADVAGWVGSGAATISHDATQAKLDGGSLKAVYQGTGNGNVMSGSFGITANQFYRLQFSVVGNGLGNVYLRLNDVSQNPYQILQDRYFAYDTNRKNYELFFQSPDAVTASKILFITTTADADTYWLDNVTWAPVTAVLNDAKQFSPLFSNTTGNPQTVTLSKKYFDLDGKAVTGSLTLPAFSSKVLITYDNTPVSPTPQTVVLTVAKTGDGMGTITSSAGQGTGVNCGTTCTETYTSGRVVTLTATPDAGSTFTGWTGTGCAGTFTITANMSCTATFTLATVALTLNTAGTGKGKVSSAPTGIDCGVQCTANYPIGSSVSLTATPETGSVFTSWSGNCAGTTSPLTVTMDTTRTCTATFDLSSTPPPTTNALTITKVGNGTVTSQPAGITCGATCSANYPAATVVTLTATPETGSTFVGFSGDTGCNSGQVTLNTPVNCIATFAVIPPPTPSGNNVLTVTKVGNGTVTSQPAGISCGATCSANYPAATVVTLTATPETGSTFVGFSGDTGCDGGQVTLNTSVNCIATFAVIPPPPPTGSNALTITKVGNGTVTSQPAGIACGATCTANYPTATVVTLTATPETGSKFVGFSGDTGCNSRQITLNTSVNCIATFEVTSPPPPTGSNTLTITKVGNGTVTSQPTGIACGATCTANYPTATVVTLTATPETGSKFVGFSGDTNCNRGQVTLHTPVNCVATFETLTVEIPIVLSIPTCLTSGTINEHCRGHGGTLTVNIGPQGFVRDAVLEGTITNDGWLSNITVKAEATVKGGVVTGYVTNYGTMSDFDFVGIQLKGGILSGNITNTSKVGGTFIDVTLAPNTHLRGGRLQGTIKGDVRAPALLENLRVLAGSHLSGVTLGKNVTLEKGVIVDRPLPDLGEATATDAKGNSVTTTTKFTGGVAINGATTFEPVQKEVKNFRDTVDIRGNITVDAAHIGQKVDMVLYTSYQATSADKPLYFMLDSKSGIHPWDEKLASLVAFQQEVTLTAEQSVEMWQGVLPITAGILQIHFGYRLPDGTVVENTKTIDVTVK